MKQRMIALLLAATLLLCTCCAAVPEQPAQTDPDAESTAPTEEPQGEAYLLPIQKSVPFTEPDGSFHETVTVMIYMTGSDLESGYQAATDDLEEMRVSGVDLSSVNLLVFTGGAEAWHNGVPCDKNALLRLTEDGFETVETFGEQSMGSAENLTRFLDYSYENCPADSYMLLFWDHGSGPVIGYGIDRRFDNDTLTLPELQAALDASAFGEDNKLSLIGFDACLMASAELVCAVSPYAEYLISSQEAEPCYGWDYSFLEYCGQLPAKTLAGNIVSRYLSYAEVYSSRNPLFCSDVTLSVVDLSCADALQKAIRELFSVAETDVSAHYARLAYARVHSHGLGRSSTGSEYDLVDLCSLMEQMRQQYPEQTAAVTEVLQDAVCINGANIGDVCGMSLFYPYFNKSYFENAWQTKYSELGIFPEYAGYLDRYSQIWLNTDMQSYFDDTATPQPVGERSYSVRLTPEQAENFAYGTFYIAHRIDGECYRMDYSSSSVTLNGDTVTADFNGKVIYRHGSRGTMATMPTRQCGAYGSVTEMLGVAGLAGSLEDEGELLAVEMPLSVDTETGKITVKGVYPTEDSDLVSGKRPLIDYLQWDMFAFIPLDFYITRDAKGDMLPLIDGELCAATGYYGIDTDALQLEYAPLYDDGNEYFLQLVIYDVQGGCHASELLPIQLEQAPEEVLPEQTLNWKGSEPLILSETEDYTLSLHCFDMLPSYEKTLWLSLENRTDEEIYVKPEDVAVNGSLRTKVIQSSLYACPGITGILDLSEVFLLLQLSDQEALQELKMTLHVFSGAADLTPKTVFDISCADMECEPSLRPFWGVSAEPQTVLQTDGIQIRLEAFGKVPDKYGNSDKDLGLLLCCETVSANADIRFEGFVLNDSIFFEKCFSMQPAPGTVSRKYDTVSLSDLEKNHCTELHSLSLVFSIDGAWSGYPVILNGAVPAEPAVPEGTILYEDETVQVRCVGSSYNEDNSVQSWSLCLVNKADRIISFCILPADTQDTLLCRMLVLPGCMVYDELDLKCDAPADFAVIAAEVYCDDPYVSEPFVLPAAQEVVAP